MKLPYYRYQPATLRSVYERNETEPSLSLEDYSESTFAGAVSEKFLRIGKMQTKPQRAIVGVSAEAADVVS